MMTVLSLWLPILIAAVVVFLASSVIHMMLGFHKNDVGAIPTNARWPTRSVRSRSRRATTRCPTATRRKCTRRSSSRRPGRDQWRS